MWRLFIGWHQINIENSLVQVIGPSRASIESHLSGYYYDNAAIVSSF